MALWQANHVKNLLLNKDPELKIEIMGVCTYGDQDISTPILELGGKQVFVKEVQKTLLENKADLAVHCIKDMSVFTHPELTIAAILKREDPRDALVSYHPILLSTLPENAIVGTGSPRRKLLLHQQRPDLVIKNIRGNVNTRLEKLRQGEYDAIVLSCSGLDRLNLAHLIQERLPLSEFVPAIGQGALGLECLKTNTDLITLLQDINHPCSQQQIVAEQAVNQVLQGGCHSPIGAYATVQQDQLHLRAIVGSIDAKQVVSASSSAPLHEAQHLGERVGQTLANKGALKLLNPK